MVRAGVGTESRGQGRSREERKGEGDGRCASEGGIAGSRRERGRWLEEGSGEGTAARHHGTRRHGGGRVEALRVSEGERGVRRKGREVIPWSSQRASERRACMHACVRASDSQRVSQQGQQGEVRQRSGAGPCMARG